MKEYKVKVYDDRTEWWLNGKLHREDGPAVEYVKSDKYWYLNGKYHREDGPAIEYKSGSKDFPYLYGVNERSRQAPHTPGEEIKGSLLYKKNQPSHKKRTCTLLYIPIVLMIK